jgi:hypothetical protein
MKMLILLCLAVCFSLLGQAQGGGVGTPTATGTCDVANTGSQNTVTINCGVGKEQGQKILAILNKILSKQLDPDVVMGKLDEIGSDVKKLHSGVYSGYDFNGAKRDQRPGVSNVVIGEEFGVFQQMGKLESEKNWKELRTLAEQQIKKTPDWLTPYLFSGVAEANLGNKAAAIARLKYVRDQAAGNPDYADAERLLKMLE